MHKYHKRRREHNPDQLDLFHDYRERELRHASRAIRNLALRFGLSVEHASAVAAANGYGSEPTR